MEEPVSCFHCWKIIELSDTNFYVPGYCLCAISCTHGLCDECKDELEEAHDN